MVVEEEAWYDGSKRLIRARDRAIQLAQAGLLETMDTLGLVWPGGVESDVDVLLSADIGRR